ncbi:MAG: PKD domain-containing protein, partial [Pirellulales bacterium]|nr:PKD domain-containing protein [Pirellulales bacterium]
MALAAFSGDLAPQLVHLPIHIFFQNSSPHGATHRPSAKLGNLLPKSTPNESFFTAKPGQRPRIRKPQNMRRSSWLDRLSARLTRGKQRRTRCPRETLWNYPTVRKLEPRRVLDASIQGILDSVLIADVDDAGLNLDSTNTAELQFDWTDFYQEAEITEGNFDHHEPPMVNEQLLESFPPSTSDFSQNVSEPSYKSEPSYELEHNLLDDSENIFANIDPITYRFDVDSDVDNVAPSDIQIEPVLSAIEGHLVTLNISFTDPNTEDAHLILIDWGTFSGPERVFPAVGNRTVLATHFYSDDPPSGTSMDTYVINVEVIDNQGGHTANNTSLIVSNSPPEFVSISDPAPLYENGNATLFFTFSDLGTADQHTASIDWGDGSAPETLALSVGERNLTTTHQYLDDNPTDTPHDTYTITATVTDDDGGSAVANTSVEV